MWRIKEGPCVPALVSAVLWFAAAVGVDGARDGALDGALAGPPSDSGAWVVEIDLSARDVDHLAEVVEPWAVYPEKGLAIARVDAEQWRRLVAGGFRVAVDIGRTLNLDRPRPATQLQEGIPGFPCYRTVEESYAAAAELVRLHPDLVRWRRVGDSWERAFDATQGYGLRVLTIGKRPSVRDGAPPLLVFGGLHAREYTTAELALRFAELLVSEYGRDPDLTWIVDEREIHIVFQANPDGRKEAESGKLWRKNKNNFFCAETDSRGIDLNRNFEFGWACCGGGSRDECSSTFRGPAAGSEPETEAYIALMRELFDDYRPPALDAPADEDAEGIFLDLHSFGEDVLWSWGFTTDRPPNDAALYSLGRKLAFFNGYRPQHGSLSTVDGATKDFAYGELGIPGFTIELGTDFFQDCASFERRIAPQNLDMLSYAAKVAAAPYRMPAGPDAVEPTFAPRVFFQGELAELTVLLDDTRYSGLNGSEPSQSIVGAVASIDELPGPSRAGQPLAPLDGAFDSPLEEASVSIPTDALSVGRHTVFVRARDATGATGAVSSTFLFVVEPGRERVVEGRVYDVDTNDGVGGAMHAGPFRARVNEASGIYRLLLPPEGVWPVVFEPDDLRRYRSRLGPTARPQTDGQKSLRHDFAVGQSYVLDELEWRAAGWVQLQDVSLGAGSKAIWSDSPDGDYPPRSERMLASEPFDVRNQLAGRLLFRHAYEFESGFDFGVVEVSRDGSPWQALAHFTGTQSSWMLEEIPIEGLGGVERLRVRFRATSDETVERDGWHVADPVIALD